MPKVKTRKIVLKRFKITKTGKVMHRIQGQRHIRRNKSKSLQRDYAIMQEVKSNAYARKIKSMMGK